jgi:hypothetical protein
MMGENKTLVSIGNIQEDFIVLSIPVLFFDIKHIKTDVSKKPDHLGGTISFEALKDRDIG